MGMNKIFLGLERYNLTGLNFCAQPSLTLLPLLLPLLLLLLLLLPWKVIHILLNIKGC